MGGVADKYELCSTLVLIALELQISQAAAGAMLHCTQTNWQRRSAVSLCSTFLSAEQLVCSRDPRNAADKTYLIAPFFAVSQQNQTQSTFPQKEWFLFCAKESFYFSNSGCDSSVKLSLHTGDIIRESERICDFFETAQSKRFTEKWKVWCLDTSNDDDDWWRRGAGG